MVGPINVFEKLLPAFWDGASPAMYDKINQAQENYWLFPPFHTLSSCPFLWNLIWPNVFVFSHIFLLRRSVQVPQRRCFQALKKSSVSLTSFSLLRVSLLPIWIKYQYLTKKNFFWYISWQENGGMELLHPFWFLWRASFLITPPINWARPSIDCQIPLESRVAGRVIIIQHYLTST